VQFLHTNFGASALREHAAGDHLLVEATVRVRTAKGVATAAAGSQPAANGSPGHTTISVAESNGMEHLLQPRALVRGPVRLLRRPILRRKLHSPEMRARREEFHAHARAFFRGVAQIDDPALLLFFGHGVDQHQIAPDLERFMQVEEAAMRVDHDGLAVFLELAASDIFPARADGNPRKNAGTASFCGVLCFCLHGSHSQSCNARRPESTASNPCVPKKAVCKSLLNSRSLAYNVTFVSVWFSA
jgi:hypothetical protein